MPLAPLGWTTSGVRWGRRDLLTNSPNALMTPKAGGHLREYCTRNSRVETAFNNLLKQLPIPPCEGEKLSPGVENKPGEEWVDNDNMYLDTYNGQWTMDNCKVVLDIRKQWCGLCLAPQSSFQSRMYYSTDTTVRILYRLNVAMVFFFGPHDLARH